MTLALNPAAIKHQDRLLVEACLPAHLMFLMVEECAKIGLELRADVAQKLNVASVVPLAKCDELTISRVAKRVDDTARTLLHDLSPDDPRHGLYCCAMFCLTLVDESLLHDVKNMAVLVSLMLMDDVRDERPDEAGNLAVWRLQEPQWKAEAKKLLRRAELMGLYPAINMQLTAQQ